MKQHGKHGNVEKVAAHPTRKVQPTAFLRYLSSHQFHHQFTLLTLVHRTLFLFLSAIGYLTFQEYVFNFDVIVEERVHVNATSPAGLEMEFDVTLPGVPCAILSIDANDPTGQRQSLHLDKVHHVWKHRMSNRGHFIGQRSKIELGSTLLEEDHLFDVVKDITGDNETDHIGELSFDKDPDYCGSCYGAGEEDECCNTCDDVKRAYISRGWVLQQVDKVEQCKGMITSKEESGEGCNVHGKVALSSGGGNLHLAPNRGLETFGSGEAVNIVDVFLRAFEQFNVSHTVNKIRFGDAYPGHINQLDGQERNIEDAYGMYQYYIQVVPTLYKFLNGTTIHTNQYSVTEHMRHVNPGSGRGLPGVFFFYEVSALHVEIEETRRGFIAFFTSIAAIVGGVVTVIGMLDQMAFARGAKSTQLLR